MTSQDILQQFPTKRLHPYDGMAVTAGVWEEAHAYHREQQRIHARFGHGAGILTGLEVVASDPADTSVYIQPGIAFDSLGNMIAVTEPIAYDFGRTSEGLVYLLISYGESRPQHGNGQSDADGRLYVRTSFSVEASSVLPNEPVLELARIRRSSRDAALHDAADRDHPDTDELDLRYRREIGATPSTFASIGVSYLGDEPAASHGRGADYLARALSRSDGLTVRVDDEVPLSRDLSVYTLIYLVAHGAFDLKKETLEAIYDYVQSGGTLLLEACRHAGDAAAAEIHFEEMLESLGIEMETPAGDHPLLHEPHLFAAPPAGIIQNDDTLQVGTGVLLSTTDYGCLWAGRYAEESKPPTREVIRTAYEWGGNIVVYALNR